MNLQDTEINTPVIHEHTSDALTVPQVDRAVEAEGQALPTQGHSASNLVDDFVVACRDFVGAIRADRRDATRMSVTDHFVDPNELRAKSREEHGARIDRLHEELLFLAHLAGCRTDVSGVLETIRYWLDAFERWSYASIEAHQRYNGSPLDEARTQFNAELNKLARYRTTLREAIKPSDTVSHTTATTHDRPRPSHERAYCSYLWACSECSDLADEPDDSVYDWLREHGPSEYELPSKESWKRYLRSGRALYGTQKHHRRTGRRLGRSVVEQHAL